jgi:hypothetical protein
LAIRADLPAVFRGQFRGLLCGIGAGENRSVLRTGLRVDTSPLGGLLRSAARIPCGNLLKNQNMNGKTRPEARFSVTAG